VQAENAWSDIDVQLKRRWDLIPNLVEVVKGTPLTKSRRSRRWYRRVISQSCEGARTRAAAESALTGALKTLFAVAEQYPQLRAVESFGPVTEGPVRDRDSIQNSAGTTTRS